MSFVLIEKNDKYLLIKEASPKWSGEWFFPGGKVDSKESVMQAAVREVREEADSAVNDLGLFYFRLFPDCTHESIHLYFHGETPDMHTKNAADEDSLGSRWFDYSELSGLRLRQNAIEVIDAWRQVRYQESSDESMALAG